VHNLIRLPRLMAQPPEKALHESGEASVRPNLTKFRARIEFIGDFEDVKKIKEVLRSLENKS
jgi:hypothetical protein